MVILQGNMFAVTLYDAVYLYLKLASEVVHEVGPVKAQAFVTNGTYMCHRVRNHLSPSSEYCYGRTFDVPLHAYTLRIFNYLMCLIQNCAFIPVPVHTFTARRVQTVQFVRPFTYGPPMPRCCLSKWLNIAYCRTYFTTW